VASRAGNVAGAGDANIEKEELAQACRAQIVGVPIGRIRWRQPRVPHRLHALDLRLT
jgi:hypothetical protein